MPQPYFLSLTGASTRNNFDGPVGFDFFIGPNPIIVSSLARWIISGNNQTHLLQLTTGIAGTNPTVLGSVTINASGAAVGWKYGNLTTPVLLTPGVKYAVMSTEANTLDTWYDSNGAVTYTTDLTYVNDCYVQANSLTEIFGSGSPYAGVNFLYDVQQTLQPQACL